MSELLKAPAIPLAILNFFSQQPDLPALMGDIGEEFQQRAQSAGANAAKRWYWREAFRNSFALTRREVLRTPVRTAFMALGCLMAVNMVTVSWYFLQTQPEIFYLDRNRRYLFLLLQAIAPPVMGWIGGKLLPGREWALALMFTVLSGLFALPGTWYVLFVLKEPYPATLLQVLTFGILVRQGSFWAGALWARRSKKQSRPVEV